jgi:hypothetical protein
VQRVALLAEHRSRLVDDADVLKPIGVVCRRPQGSRMVLLALLPEPRPKARNLPTRSGARDVGAQANRIRHAGSAVCWVGRLQFSSGGDEVVMGKSSDKPRKQQKQKPQKTLKERRNEKRAAKKLSTGSFLPPST